MWRAVPLVAVLAAAMGCGHNIGDPCQTNVDCSPAGDRYCDTGSLGGYCTQENCDVNSCPGNSVCIRFFTALMNEPCTFDPDTRISTGCRSDERCVTDNPVTKVSDCGQDANKMPACAGHCAPNSSEHRWCQARCSNDGDCRGGYMCRQTGTAGAEPVPTFDMSLGDPAKFCAPTGLSS
jgi:hypothetical protein